MAPHAPALALTSKRMEFVVGAITGALITGVTSLIFERIRDGYRRCHETVDREATAARMVIYDVRRRLHGAGQGWDESKTVEIVNEQSPMWIQDSELRRLLTVYAAVAFRHWRDMKGVQGAHEGVLWGAESARDVEDYLANSRGRCDWPWSVIFARRRRKGTAKR